jgi:hypothetical protein
MEYKNTVYAELQTYIKAHHGFSKDDLSQTELYKRYIAEMELIKAFDGKRVKLLFSYQVDWLSGNDTKQGIIKIADDAIRFFEGRHTRHYKKLDAGLYDGFYATLIPLSISEV